MRRDEAVGSVLRLGHAHRRLALRDPLGKPPEVRECDGQPGAGCHSIVRVPALVEGGRLIGAGGASSQKPHGLATVPDDQADLTETAGSLSFERRIPRVGAERKGPPPDLDGVLVRARQSEGLARRGQHPR